MSANRQAAAALSLPQQKQIERLAAEMNWSAEESQTPVAVVSNITKHPEIVGLELMQVDRVNYQRELESHRLDTLRRDWNDEAAGVFALSRREDGSLWLLDGQHRGEVMKERGQTKALCIVYSGLSIAQEADLFDQLNDRLRVHVITRFNARLRAGRPTELAISKLLELYGTKVAWVTSEGYPCVAEVTRLYEHGALRDTIEILEACWQYEDIHRSPVVVRAMGQFCMHYTPKGSDGVPKPKLDKFIAKFSSIELKPLVLLARATAPGTGKPHWWWLTSSFHKTHGGRR